MIEIDIVLSTLINMYGKCECIEKAWIGNSWPSRKDFGGIFQDGKIRYLIQYFQKLRNLEKIITKQKKNRSERGEKCAKDEKSMHIDLTKTVLDYEEVENLWNDDLKEHGG